MQISHKCFQDEKKMLVINSVIRIYFELRTCHLLPFKSHNLLKIMDRCKSQLYAIRKTGEEILRGR